MGLDAVELVMEVEEAFDVNMRDAEVSGIYTVGDLFDTLRKHWRLQHADRCMSAAAFYDLRRGLKETALLERAAVRPSSVLADLIPITTRKAVWTKFRHSAGLAIPGLVRPPWLVVTALAAVFALTATAWFFLPGGVLSALTVAALVCVLGWLAARLTAPFARRFSCRTVGQLATSVLDLNFRRIATSRGFVNEHEAWNRLVTIIHEQLGRPRKEILWDTPFSSLWRS